MCGHRHHHRERRGRRPEAVAARRVDSLAPEPPDAVAARRVDPLVPEPLHLRASDAERERVVEALRAHAAEGRLAPDELEQRIEGAYAAATRAELRPLLADLPAPRPA